MIDLDSFSKVTLAKVFSMKKHWPRIYKLFLLKLVHFCLYQRPDVFQEHFFHSMPNDRYPTRNNKIKLPQIRLNIEKQSTIFNCCKVINELENEFFEFQNKTTLNKRQWLLIFSLVFAGFWFFYYQLFFTWAKIYNNNYTNSS